MPTATIEVAAVTAPDQWTLGAGADKVVAVNGPNDEAASYIQAAAIDIYEQYSLGIHTIPTGSVIERVSVYSRARRAAGSTRFNTGLVLTGNTSSSLNHSPPAAWTSYLDIFDRPGGGAWKIEDLATLEVFIRYNIALTNVLLCTSLWIKVDYTPPPSAMFLLFP